MTGEATKGLSLADRLAYSLSGLIAEANLTALGAGIPQGERASFVIAFLLSRSTLKRSKQADLLKQITGV